MDTQNETTIQGVNSMNTTSHAVQTPQNFTAYEYKSVIATRELASVYADCYPGFGWTLEDNTFNNYSNKVRLTFKRKRQLKNKPEINKLQRQFEESVENIAHMKETKTSRAGIMALVVGLIGTAFLAGATFSFLAGYIIACIILAIPGFIGWGAAYVVYQRLANKRSAEIVPLIDQEYDSLYSYCEKANALLF